MKAFHSISTSLFLAVVACRSDSGPKAPDPSGPLGAGNTWTDAFLGEAVLVADEIWIEGPEDLLEHVAIRQDPEVLDYATTTTSEGLRQEIVRKEGESAAEIRAQIDAWSVVALQKLVVLQRPGAAPVRIVATGEAAWVPVSGVEQRGPRLEFRGDRRSR